MMFSLSHLERQWAARAHRYRSLYIRSSVLGVDFEHIHSLTSHFAKIRRFNSSVPIDSSVSKDDKSKSTERVDWRPLTSTKELTNSRQVALNLLKVCS